MRGAALVVDRNQEAIRLEEVEREGSDDGPGGGTAQQRCNEEHNVLG